MLPENPDDENFFIDKGINNYFDENGISSMFSVKNLGSTLVYIAFIAVAYLALILSYIFQGIFGIFESTHKFIKKYMLWNFTLRLLIQQFQPIIMFSIINLYHLDNELNIYLSSTVLTFIQVIMVHLIIPIMAVKIYSHDQSNTLESEKFKNTYGTMLDGLSLNGKIGKYWNILVLIRWSLVSIILVTLRDYSTAQIQLNIIISWFFQFLILKGKPLDDSFENNMLLFNEIMVSVYLYVLTSLTDYNDDADLFDNCGIAALTIVMISFAVNFLKFAFFTLRHIYRRFRRYLCHDNINNQKSDATVSIKPLKNIPDDNY